MNNEKTGVVITGIGVISPNGIGKKNFWDAIVNGKSAVERITAFDVSQFNSQVASEVKGFNPRAFNLREDQIRRMDRYVQFAVAGAKMAVSDAGIDFASEDRGAYRRVYGQCNMRHKIYGRGVYSCNTVGEGAN